jgi:hypothetical protein
MMKLGVVTAVVASMATVGVSTAGALAPLSASEHMLVQHPTLVVATVSSAPSSKVITVKYAVDCSTGSLTGHFLASSGESRALRLPKDAVKCVVSLTSLINGDGSIHERLAAKANQ